MATWINRASTWLFGDPSLEGLQERIGTYEEMHAEIQKILVPVAVPAGIQINATQPLNRNFAISSRQVAGNGEARLSAQLL